MRNIGNVSQIWDRRLNGRVEFEELSLADNQTDCRARYLCAWLPPYQLACRLPNWFDLKLECVLGADGVRRFTPARLSFSAATTHDSSLRLVSDATAFAWVAAMGGLLVLEDRGAARERIVTLQEARMYQFYIRHRQEFLGKTRRLGRAIQICSTGRSSPSDKHILPAGLGLCRDGSGRLWQATDVRSIGLRAARAKNVENAEPDRILWLALLEAARLNPHRLAVDDVRGLVRLSLFDVGSAEEKVTPEQLRYVTKHVRESLHERCIESEEQLQHWIEDPDSNLLHRISKRRDCTMSRSQVRAAILELGWRSIQLLGDCVDAQMRVFRDALPEPLTRVEARMFEMTYMRNPVFSLPLILLHDRLDVLKDAILYSWNNPDDPDAVAVIHTMMSYYAEMAGNRRNADRLYKQRMQFRNPRYAPIREVSLPPDACQMELTTYPDEFGEIVQCAAMEQVWSKYSADA